MEALLDFQSVQYESIKVQKYCVKFSQRYVYCALFPFSKFSTAAFSYANSIERLLATTALNQIKSIFTWISCGKIQVLWGCWKNGSQVSGLCMRTIFGLFKGDFHPAHLKKKTFNIILHTNIHVWSSKMHSMLKITELYSSKFLGSVLGMSWSNLK